ncbi:MAG: CAP domain-containing protein [Parcubacteria group bacterium]|jgi:uncharacterized protein YkwD
MLKKSVPRYLLLGICAFLLWQILSVHILGEENKIANASSASAPQLSSFEAQIVRRINEERSTKKLPPLTINAQLNMAANQKTEDMLRRNYFSHQTPEGNFVWGSIEKNGYDYKYAGENLARNFSSPDQTVSAWMGSVTHRENILGENFFDIGIGTEKISKEEKEYFYVTVLFGKKNL